MLNFIASVKPLLKASNLLCTHVNTTTDVCVTSWVLAELSCADVAYLVNLVMS